MNHHGLALILPVELQSMIFDRLALQDLVTVSHVSTFWRAIAVCHQTYWRDVTLSDVSTTALEFFQARLAAGGHRSVTIRLLLAKFRFPVHDLRSVILPALRHNLFRTDCLVFDIDIGHEEDVFAALQHPAPQLRTLDFAIVHGNRLSDAMPPDLFACQAPNLRNVRIANIMLRGDRFPHVFSAITALRYCSEQAASFPTAVFAHSKLLKELDIYVKGLSLVPANDCAQPLLCDGLQSLDISVSSGGFDLVRRMACALIPTITVSLLDYASARLLLPHLGARLEIRIYHTQFALYVEYRTLAHTAGTTRRFICPLSQIACANLPPMYLDELTTRVQALHSSATASGFIPAFRELPACTRFTLSIQDGEPLRPPERPLSIPELQHIEVSSTTAARLTVRDLAAFLNAAFTPSSRAVQVALQGVSLDGDFAEISSDRFVLSAGQSQPALSAPSP